MSADVLMQVPTTTVHGKYKLRVEGNVNGVLGGTAFVNETDLEFSQRSMTIFVQTDKPLYMQGQTGRSWRFQRISQIGFNLGLSSMLPFICN